MVCTGGGSAPLSPAPLPLDILPHSHLGVLPAPAEQCLPTAQMVPMARGKGGETSFVRGREPHFPGRRHTDRTVSVVGLNAAAGPSVAEGRGVIYTPEMGELWATPPAAPLEAEMEEWVEERGLVRAELFT